MSNNDDLTQTLSRELDERARAMDGSILHLSDVTGKARSIRRRRTATAVAGVAAAVALIVPTVALASHTGDTKNDPAPATSPTQTATDTAHQPAPGVLDVSDLPTGEAPHIEYLDGDVLHQFDGSTVEVHTKYPISSFTVLSDGTHLWQTADDGTPYVEVQDAEGNLQAPVASGWGVGVNNANTVGAWVRPDGQVMVWNSGATQPLAYGDPIQASDDMRIGPVLGDHCGDPQDSCEVYVNVSDPNTDPTWQPWLVDVNGTQRYLDGTYLRPRRRQRGRPEHRLPVAQRLRLVLGPSRGRRVPGLQDLRPHARVVLTRLGAHPGRPGVPRRHRERRDRDVRPAREAAVGPPQHGEGAVLLPVGRMGGRHPRAGAGLPGRPVGDRPVRVRRIDGVRRPAGSWRGVDAPFILATGGPVLAD